MSDPKILPRYLPQGHGLLLRSMLVVMLASLVAGAGVVGYTAQTIDEEEHFASRARLGELLNTVESTVQVACFARDSALAGELAEGLLRNSEVQAVTIVADQQVLTSKLRKGPNAAAATGSNGLLKRPIYSPFDSRKQVGHILLSPNPLAIEARIAEAIHSAVVQLSWQLALVGIVVATTLLIFVVRPINAISALLHHMDPTAGDRLPVPRRHVDTELGQLVIDINALSERLVGALYEERRLHKLQETGERKYHAIFKNAESGIFLVDIHGSLSAWNPAFTRMFELAMASDEDEYTWLPIELLSWEHPERGREMILEALRRNAPITEDLAIRLKDGKQRWLNIVLSPIGDDQLQGVVHDVTDLKEAEASARRLAVTDSLTGLANRSGLEERLRALINEHFNAQALGFALLIVNLDEFKRINEGMGLPAGDQILRTASARLSNCVKRQDTVARLSADNFAVILRDMTAGDEVDRVSRRIQEAIRQTFIVDGSPVNLHGSIGIALFPHDAEDLPTLLRQAELALDSAKSAGGDTCVFFDPMLAEAAERRRHLETDMRNALRHDEFTLHYQPIVDLDTHRLAGAEALVRWRHPTRGLVAPDSFIPLAESTGLIVDIGLQVLDAACRQLAAWRAQGLHHYVSLNVSGRQIPDGLPPAALLQTVNRHGVPPERLALEITEGIMLRDVDKSLRWLNAVHEMGFRVYLDDFGTGYSSLSYLKQFPVDTLKVDKSFVRDMREGSSEHALVGAILAMAGSLGLDTVAEGVETVDHVRALRALGCRHVQGYLFSRPVPAEDFIATSARIEELLASGFTAG